MPVLNEMGPAVAVHGDDGRVRKGARRLHRVVGIHGEVEAPACLGSTGEQHDEPGRNQVAWRAEHSPGPSGINFSDFTASGLLPAGAGYGATYNIRRLLMAAASVPSSR